MREGDNGRAVKTTLVVELPTWYELTPSQHRGLVMISVSGTQKLHDEVAKIRTLKY